MFAGDRELFYRRSLAIPTDVVLNDVNYTFYFDNAAECSDEMLIQMASELLEAAKA